jgi:hypothetical protein
MGEKSLQLFIQQRLIARIYTKLKAQVRWLMTAIPATQKAEIGRTMAQASLCKSFHDPISIYKPTVVVCASDPSFTISPGRKIVV